MDHVWSARCPTPHQDFFLGTFAPALRASDRPIAIACLRLLTVLPDRPLFSVPCLRSCIARFTFADAFLPYFRGIDAPYVELQAKIAAAEVSWSAPSRIRLRFLTPVRLRFLLRFAKQDV